MDTEQRKELAQLVYTFRGHKAHAGGWMFPEAASLTSCLPGFYRVSWDELARASQEGGEVQAWFVGGAWLGVHCTGCASD